MADDITLPLLCVLSRAPPLFLSVAGPGVFMFVHVSRSRCPSPCLSSENSISDWQWCIHNLVVTLNLAAFLCSDVFHCKQTCPPWCRWTRDSMEAPYLFFNLVCANYGSHGYLPVAPIHAQWVCYFRVCKIGGWDATYKFYQPAGLILSLLVVLVVVLL